MESRIDVQKVAPQSIKPLLDLAAYLRHSSLDSKLLNLVYMRASQINGCAFCIDMHTKDARAEGETEQRLYELDAWRETPFYTDRERAALAWTEAVTLVNQGHVPDEVYEEARRHYSEKELVDLNMAVVAINAWNRVAISFRAVPGTYEPQQAPRRQTATRSAS